MSAGRRHRRAAGAWRSQEALRAADSKPAFSVGSAGPYEMVVKGGVMYLLARPTLGMPDELVDALALRRRATLEGKCACGGNRHIRSPRLGHVAAAYFLHEADCVAHDRAIAAIAARHGWVLRHGWEQAS